MMAYSRSLACIGAFLVVAAALAIAPCEAAAAGTSTGHHLLSVQGYKKGHGYGYKKSSYGGGHYNKGYSKKGYGRKLSGSSEAESVMPEALPAQLSDPLVATDAGVEGRALLSTQATQGYKKGHGYGYNKGYYGGGHYNKGYSKKGYGRKLSGSSEADALVQS